jgi:hypothetical protein
MTFMHSRDLGFVLRLPFADPDEVQDRIHAAMAEARTWPLVEESGDRLLINPAALRVIGIVQSESALPPYARRLPILSVGPDWDVPHTLPAGLEAARPDGGGA